MTSVRRNGRLKPNLLARVNARLRVAFYIRVSTDEQAANETPRNQIEYLERRFAPNFEDDALEPMQLVGIFSDEGVSGADPFEARPEGARLLDLARAGEVDLVIFLKLDRFGRRVTVIHDAYEQLAAHGCAIQSATEQWETRTTTGKMIFGLLAVLAEFERDTIRDRFAFGRDRVARTGRFINGVLPFGYDVKDGRLAPSDKLVEQLGMTEADVARLIFEKVASGESSGLGVAQWLTACGVPSEKVWVTKDGARSSTAQFPMWFGNRISRMIHNPIYKGERTLHHASGDIDQDVAALVDPTTWQKAQDMLGNTSNKGGMKTQTKTFTYLIGGRIFCASCDAPMQGNVQRDPKAARLYYTCARSPGKRGAARYGKCQGLAVVRGEKLEEKVINDIDILMADPKAAVDVLRQRVRERQAQGAEQETIAEHMQARLRELEHSEYQILSWMRAGRLTPQVAERSIDEIAGEMATLRTEINKASARTTIAHNLEERLVNLTRTLEGSQAVWRTARAVNDRDAMREVILGHLGSIYVEADGTARFNWTVRDPSSPNTQSLNNVFSEDGIVTAHMLEWGRGAA